MTALTAIATPDPSALPEQPLTCFVIGPIGDCRAPADSLELKVYEDALEIFERVILPACAKSGIAPVRADRIAHAGELTEQICRQLIEADLVIADVSGGNANVMWELGVRHAMGKPTIHLGEYGQLPFDISMVRTIRFKRTESELIGARKELESVMESGFSKGFDLLTPARVLRGMRVPALEPGAVGAEDDESPGLIERLAQVEDQMDAMTETMDAIGGAINVIASLTEEANPAMERASRPGAPVSARIPVMAQYAASISAPAVELKEHATRFAGQMAEVDAAVLASLDFLQGIPPEERGAETQQFLDQLVGTSAATREGMEALRLFETVLKWMIGMSRELRGPGKDISSAVKQVSRAMARIDEWDKRALAMR
ncbi:hypothetical protein [Streptomyces sp. NPDC048636]|uniref:hypothetical protein n=1 Tax=Streptomyces sp. NPDC048636 TaxID=3155762 RepID=UPI00343E4E62